MSPGLSRAVCRAAPAPSTLPGTHSQITWNPSCRNPVFVHFSNPWCVVGLVKYEHTGFLHRPALTSTGFLECLFHSLRNRGVLLRRPIGASGRSKSPVSFILFPDPSPTQFCLENPWEQIEYFLRFQASGVTAHQVKRASRLPVPPTMNTDWGRSLWKSRRSIFFNFCGWDYSSFCEQSLNLVRCVLQAIHSFILQDSLFRINTLPKYALKIFRCANTPKSMSSCEPPTHCNSEIHHWQEDLVCFIHVYGMFAVFSGLFWGLGFLFLFLFLLVRWFYVFFKCMLCWIKKYIWER